jgi:phospholipid transport system substrate-binding protein
MKSLKIILLSCTLLTCSAITAIAAEEVKAPQEASETQNSSADKFVKDTSKSVVDVLKSKSSQSEKQKKLTEIFHQTMDIEWIAKFVIGKYWKNMSEDQQREYLKNYDNYLTASYVPVFKDYNGQAVVIKTVKSIGQDSYLVVTDIKSENSDTPYRVEYRVKKTEAGFKVRDIIAEGVSMITTQRSEFGSIIGSEGVVALNKQLSSKAKELGD